MRSSDLQYALNIDFGSVIKTNNYLDIDSSLIDKFSKLDIFNTPKKKIGLFWQGNKKIFKNRSLPIDYVYKIVQNNNYKFYSFQIDNIVSDNDNIINLNEYINDYADTAALLKNMDLLVTIDSSIVHMAGAIGIKTFLLLPYTAEWRWFFDSDTSFWYDSVKIFRQSSPNNWDNVVDNLILKLDNYAY